MRKLNDNLKGLATSVLLLLASSCGGGHNAALQPSASGGGVDSQLMSALSQELASRGRDISSSTPAAPLGTANAVVDLQAHLGSAAAGLGTSGKLVQLNWTEQLAGDYDQNGEVGMSDIQPLGQYFHHSVDYAVKARVGGYPARPSGTPADSPASGLAINNWRLARIDGDSNGEIGLSDVTAIAQHWGESLSGYMVYRRAAGQSEFAPVAGAGAGQPSVARPAATSNGPVGYGFNDTVSGGVVEYFVQPVNSRTGQFGQPSPVLVVDTDTGAANLAPVAVLDAKPVHGSAGIPVTIDASASIDFDGTLTEIRWDLDADGVVDYSTNGGGPAVSSSGAVSHITPGEGSLPLTVSAVFDAPRSTAYTPRVQVVDNQQRASEWTELSLPVSGWEQQLVSSSGAGTFPGGELPFEITDMRLDPATQEVVAVGVNPGPLRGRVTGWNPDGSAVWDFDEGTDYVADAARGVYLARRDAAGLWTSELVASVNAPSIQAFGALPRNAHLAWATDGQPLVVVSLQLDPLSVAQTGVFLAHRQGAGAYDLEQLYAGPNGRGGWVRELYPRGPGKFSAEVLNSQGGTHYTYGLLTYDQGTVTEEETGCSELDPVTYVSMSSAAFSPSGDTLVGSYSLATQLELSYKLRQPDGSFADRTFDSPAEFASLQRVIQRMGYVGGKLTLLVTTFDRKPASIVDFVLQDSGDGLKPVWSHHQEMNYTNSPLASLQDGAISLVDSVGYTGRDPGMGNQTELYCHCLEGGLTFDELVYQLDADGATSVALDQLADDPQGHLACVARPKGGSYGTADTQIVLTRVGPPASE